MLAVGVQVLPMFDSSVLGCVLCEMVLGSGDETCFDVCSCDNNNAKNNDDPHL